MFRIPHTYGWSSFAAAYGNLDARWGSLPASLWWNHETTLTLPCFLGISLHRGSNLYHDYNFLEIILVHNLERRTSQQQLVCHDSDRPDIHFFVIAIFLENLRGEVERSSAEGCPKFTWVHLIYCPAEIANLHVSLHYSILTIMITMFSGLMSRWRTLFPWI